MIPSFNSLLNRVVVVPRQSRPPLIRPGLKIAYPYKGVSLNSGHSKQGDSVAQQPCFNKGTLFGLVIF